MSQLVSQEELSNLPFIEIAPFNPDHDERADFVITMPNNDEYNAAVLFNGDERHYIFDSTMPANLRAAVLDSVDILLDEHFVDLDSAQFNQDNEDPTVIYIAVHSMCRNYGLYTNCGRSLLSMQEA